MEVFNVDDVTANDGIQKNKHRQKKARVPIVLTDVNLTSKLKNNLEFCFSFLWQEHL